MNVRTKRNIEKGDLVTVRPLWNETSRPDRHFVGDVKVLDVRTDQRSRSGVMFLLEDTSGRKLWLDSAWIEEF